MQIPIVSAYGFTGTAVILGYILSNEFSIDDQAALGAWFNVVGDILASNSTMSAIIDSSNQSNQNNENEIDLLKDALSKLQDNLNELTKDNLKK